MQNDPLYRCLESRVMYDIATKCKVQGTLYAVGVVNLHWMGCVVCLRQVSTV